MGLVSVIWSLFSTWIRCHCDSLTLGTVRAADLEQSVFFSLASLFDGSVINVKRQQQSVWSVTDDEVTACYGSTRGCCLLWPFGVAVQTVSAAVSVI